MSVEKGMEQSQCVSPKEQLLRTQRQFQTPQMAQQIAQRHGLDLAMVDRPFEDGVTGDFYRLIDRDGRLVVLFGDAVGHGAHAAPVVNAIHQSLTTEFEHRLLQQSRTEGKEIDITRSIVLFDEYLRAHASTIGLEDTGIPMVMVEIDQKENVLRVANAGMEQAILLSNNKTAQLITPGVPLGILLDIKKVISSPEEEVQSVISFQNGDILILMTDGVGADKGGIDQSRGENVESRLKEITAFLKTPEAPQLTPQQLVEKISGFVRQADDDVTVMVVRL